MHSSATTIVSSIVLLLGGGSGIAALLLVRRQMRVLDGTARREDADAGAQMSAAAVALVAPYRQQVTELREELREVKRQIARLERLRAVWELEAQQEVQRLGGHLRPPPQLDDITS